MLRCVWIQIGRDADGRITLRAADGRRLSAGVIETSACGGPQLMLAMARTLRGAYRRRSAARYVLICNQI